MAIEGGTEKNHPAIETLKEIARCGYGAGAQSQKRPSTSRSKEEIITMARETCDRAGIQWSVT